MRSSERYSFAFKDTDLSERRLGKLNVSLGYAFSFRPQTKLLFELIFAQELIV